MNINRFVASGLNSLKSSTGGVLESDANALQARPIACELTSSCNKVIAAAIKVWLSMMLAAWQGLLREQMFCTATCAFHLVARCCSGHWLPFVWPFKSTA